MNTKRNQNRTALKFKFLAPTNTKDARIKITQLNNRKSKIIPQDYRFEVLDNCVNFLENRPLITSYSLLVDNTQSGCFTFVIETEGSSFPELI